MKQFYWQFHNCQKSARIVSPIIKHFCEKQVLKHLRNTALQINVNRKWQTSASNSLSKQTYHSKHRQLQQNISTGARTCVIRQNKPERLETVTGDSVYCLSQVWNPALVTCREGVFYPRGLHVYRMKKNKLFYGDLFYFTLFYCRCASALSQCTHARSQQKYWKETAVTRSRQSLLQMRNVHVKKAWGSEWRGDQ